MLWGLHACTTSVLGLLVSWRGSVGSVVSYLCLVGACNGFCCLDLILITCQFFLAVLLGARFLPGLLGCAHIVVLWLLQMIGAHDL